MFVYLLKLLVMSTKHKEYNLPSSDVLAVEKKASQLIVHNDDVNTFDWVIESLISICDHSEVQAEQCSIIIHNKGKCVVKSGDFEALKPMKDGLTDRGIQATIED